MHPVGKVSRSPDIVQETVAGTHEACENLVLSICLFTSLGQECNPLIFHNLYIFMTHESSRLIKNILVMLHSLITMKNHVFLHRGSGIRSDFSPQPTDSASLSKNAA